MSKKFRLYTERHQTVKQAVLRRKRAESDEFWALTDITFDVHDGEAFGIIGHNGSGKSTLLKCLTQILQPDSGSVAVHGSVSALLELGAGFHPELTGRENVFLNAAILGVPRKEIAKRFDDIVEFAGLEQFIDTPVKNYSSGMFVRLGFAVAINVEPDVLIIDEVLSVGDAEFQARCGDKIAEFREAGRTIILVTHSMPDVVRLCDRAAWIDHGNLKAVGATHEIADRYLDTTHTGRGVTIGGDHRWGSGDATIEFVDLRDEQGTPVNFVRTGDYVIVFIGVKAHRPLANPEVGFSIHDQNSNLVTEVNTTGRAVDTASIDDGAWRIYTFHIPSLPLNQGSYEMSFKVLDETGQREFDVRSRLLRFDVMKGEHADGGTVTFGGVWDVSHQHDPEPTVSD